MRKKNLTKKTVGSIIPRCKALELYTVEIMKDFYLAELFNIYGALLTDNQREIMRLSYDCDLSLGEIAEEKSISRQSANDALAKAKQQLEAYEDKLKLLCKFKRIKEILDGSAEQEKVFAILEEN